MSDPFGTPHRASGGPSSSETVHEAYSFACMRCGYGWEQAFEIAHHTDEHGHTNVIYYADGVRVPSPLTRPSCGNCGGHLVRIMRSGRVSSVSRERWSAAYTERAAKPARDPRTGGAFPTVGSLLEPPDDLAPDGTAAADKGGERHGNGEGEPHHRHHWLADFLAFFHHRKAPEERAHHDHAA
jgi:hypothetical protein